MNYLLEKSIVSLIWQVLKRQIFLFFKKTVSDCTRTQMRGIFGESSFSIRYLVKEEKGCVGIS